MREIVFYPSLSLLGLKGAPFSHSLHFQKQFLSFCLIYCGDFQDMIFQLSGQIQALDRFCLNLSIVFSSILLVVHVYVLEIYFLI